MIRSYPVVKSNTYHARYWSNWAVLRGFFFKKITLFFFFRSDKFLHKLKTLTTLQGFFFLIQIIFYRHQRMGSKIKTEAVLAVEQATSWNGLHLKFLPSSAKTSEKRLSMNKQSCIQQWQEFTSWEPLKWLEENKPAHSHEVWFSHLSNSLHLSIDFGGPSGFFPLDYYWVPNNKQNIIWLCHIGHFHPHKS